MTMVNLFSIRSWDGAQHRAWEELAYQLHHLDDPEIVETRKTKAPDGGVEWYTIHADGHEEGFQAKFYANLAAAISAMRESVETVVKHHPRMTRLSFVVPFDFTDQPVRAVKDDQERWEEATVRWSTEIEGADRLSFDIVRGGDSLNKLMHSANAGHRAFWFDGLGLNWELLGKWWNQAEAVVGERYTPAAHTQTSLKTSLDGAALSTKFLEHLNTLVQELEELFSQAATDHVDSATEFRQLATDLSEARRVIGDAYPEIELDALRLAVAEGQGQIDSVSVHVQNRKSPNEHETGPRQGDPFHQISTAIGALRDFLESTPARAAESRALVITGRSGQGKTHEILQAASDLLAVETPAVVLLGVRFSRDPWWTSAKDQLGGLSATADEFFGELGAMAAAAGDRAVLFIDALNESQDARNWEAELPDLLAVASAHPWVSVVVSFRTDYADLIAAPSDLPRVAHRGFIGHEDEALRRYCDHFGVPVPILSTLDPAFSNPLFLRLFCEVGASDKGGPSGPTNPSALFEQFATLRAGEVHKRLKLPTSSDVAMRALDLVADALIDKDASRGSVEPLVNALCPQKVDWPDTMFGVLVTVGLVELAPSHQKSERVQLPFQSFSEHIVVSRLLTRYGCVEGRLTDEALEEITAGRRFWRSAAILLPERYGLELIDLLSEITEKEDFSLKVATIDSFVDRAAGAHTDRTGQLIATLRDRQDTGELVHEAILQLAPRTGHPYDGMWLHKQLCDLPMALRDATWGIESFYDLDESAAFDRLLRWAVVGDPQASDEQLMVAAIPLVWALSSPNRLLRDVSTKALVELFRHRLGSLALLLQQLVTVDDPYVKQRILAITYGALVRGGDDSSDEATKLAAEVSKWFEDGHIPVDALARDSARGVLAWAADRELVSEEVLASGSPRYRSSPPIEPPSADALEACFGATETEPRESRASAILRSCLTWMGDFNKYVVDGDVGSFSWHPLDGPAPSESKYQDPLGRVEADWAGRWIADRAIDLGWTPERFEEFERTDLHNGRESHKPERFGKKYQWIGLHELLARLADNYHPSLNWADHAGPYSGPWTWSGRDIDPTIPWTQEVGGKRNPTLGLIADPGWQPLEPELDLPEDDEAWSGLAKTMPMADDLAISSAESGEWVTLWQHANWSRRTEDQRPQRNHRTQWIVLLSWLTQPGEGHVLIEHLQSVGLFGRWMPERNRTANIYLGEGAWSIVQQSDPPEWELPRKGSHSLDIEVLPAVESFIWEGNVRDCSLDESVHCYFPIPALLGDAEWDRNGTTWVAGSQVVAQYEALAARPHDHSILRIRRDWVQGRLRNLEKELVVGVLSERMAMRPDDDLRAATWTTNSSAALLTPSGEFNFSQPSQEHGKNPKD